MARAITEGWPLDPEKRQEVIENLFDIASGRRRMRGERINTGDETVAARALMEASKMELAEEKLTADVKQAEKPKVIVVRRIGGGPALPPPETGIGED
jgi:hypothetical protein